jgi:hypothetical protein
VHDLRDEDAPGWVVLRLRRLRKHLRLQLSREKVSDTLGPVGNHRTQRFGHVDFVLGR